MAVQIARIENGRLHVDTEAIGNVLDKVGAHPVAVIAINGPLNRGKSNIINRLLSQQAAHKENVKARFHHIEMSERLWKNAPDQPNEIRMWPEPLMMKHNGQSTAVLIMSVHGNLDNSVTTMDNALIFTFGCLLASVTIYHVQYGLSEDMLQFLQMIIASTKSVSHQDDCRPFAKLLFVINDWRSTADFNYGYHEDHSPPSTRNFKKEILDVHPEMMPENRVVRQEILSSFMEVCCCLAPYFGDEKVNDNGPLELQALKNWIFINGRSIKKTVQRRAVTGIELKGFVQNWAGSLATSKISVVRTELEAPYEVTDAMALSVALKFFHLEIASATNGTERLTDDQLIQVHAHLKQETVAMFRRLIPPRLPAVLQLYEYMLDAEMVDYLGTCLLRNDERGQNRQFPGQEQVHCLIEDPVIAQREECECASCVYGICLYAISVCGICLYAIIKGICKCIPIILLNMVVALIVYFVRFR